MNKDERVQMGSQEGRRLGKRVILRYSWEADKCLSYLEGAGTRGSFWGVWQPRAHCTHVTDHSSNLDQVTRACEQQASVRH